MEDNFVFLVRVVLDVNREDWGSEDVTVDFYKETVTKEILSSIWVEDSAPAGSSVTQESLPFEVEEDCLYYESDDTNFITLIENKCIQEIERIKCDDKIYIKCKLIS